MRKSFLLFLLILGVWPAFSQEITPSATPPPSITNTLTASPTVTATSTLTATLTASATATFTATFTWTPTATFTAEQTAEATPQVTPSETVETSPEVTAEITIEPTAERTPETTPESTVEVTAEPTAEITAQPTEVITQEATAERTPEITPETTEEVTATEAQPTPTIELSITPTATPGDIPLRYVQGIVTYQNRASQAGITVQIFAEDGTLISVGTTNASGIYSLPAPSEQPYQVLAEAPLHQSRQQIVPVGEMPAEMTLSGGDMNADGCINQADIDLLVAYLESTNSAADITGDGLSNLADLAILTGNFNPACVVDPQPEATDEATEAVESTPEITAEATEESSLEEITPGTTLESPEAASNHHE